MVRLKSIEICAGAGGQALGLEKAGFEHEALVKIDKDVDFLPLNPFKFPPPEADKLKKGKSAYKILLQ